LFHNRQRELGYLERRYARMGAEFVVLWGRQGVGKSRLLYEWCREKPHLYFFAARLPSQVLRDGSNADRDRLTLLGTLRI
jgi:AAA+ ATPase superfamily predicted ATPase